MERNTFDTHLKELIVHLYDSVALETHPLTAALEIPAEYRGKRGEYVRKTIAETIELFRPPVHPPNPHAPEWRAYLILYHRYIESTPPPTLATQLALSERQLRRDHSRALEALSQKLWEQFFPIESRPSSDDEFAPVASDFTFNPQRLDLVQVLNGVLSVLEKRILSEKVQIQLDTASSAIWDVLADRIVLRQMLFSLFSYAFRLQAAGKIEARLSIREADIQLEVKFEVAENWSTWDANQGAALLETTRDWGKRMGIRVEDTHPPAGKPGWVFLTISMPSANQDVVLVVDDQQPALRMYQRYLSRTSLRVIGLDDPTQAINTTRHLLPVLILLDVMMPNIDGWEILQSLQADDQINHIPVIICSAWEASEMAHSLGASSFLKKPITQRDLLTALQQINLIETTQPVGSASEESSSGSSG